MSMVSEATLPGLEQFTQPVAKLTIADVPEEMLEIVFAEIRDVINKYVNSENFDSVEVMSDFSRIIAVIRARRMPKLTDPAEIAGAIKAINVGLAMATEQDQCEEAEQVLTAVCEALGIDQATIMPSAPPSRPTQY